MEEQYQCNYVISAKRNKGENTEIIYYKCNRSNINKVTIKEHRQRNLKSQGTCKLNFTCTSQIKVVYKSNKCSIHWIKTHYNHKTELEHIRLSSRMKNEIAAKLVSGLSDQRVLEINRDKIGEHLKRIDLLTSKDVDNIKVKYNIEAKYGKRHPNDALSVNLWVRECQSKPPHENMVLFYKKQGEDSEDFRKMDFCLIIMNSFQELMVKKFGNNVIAVDSTHGLNDYDFEMSTLMIIDDFGEGVPVAFMFSNRKDTYVYHVFFKTIMTRIGKINARTFMSDLAESLYKAWCSIMGQVRYHLFYSWHVDRAWQTNLSKIRSKDKRSEIYQILKVLQSEIDEVEFEKKLVSAINIMLDDDDTKIFGSYFQLNYLKNTKQWAYCFRKSTGINTNMRLESMHKVIKYFYLNHKKIRRLDKGLHAVLRYIKNKNVERIIKLTKGKNTIYNRDIFKRHKLAFQSTFNYTVNNNNVFQ
ncbi:uncharacterized protein LOC126749605 [Anthonomus grandis grandis]|uniref:uncharacterized protein LOC126749605 n=1 Tax=Anthonomus grandis grandis TaxID=2921223 RepID=UPI00216622BE|nr:uncharacterized protein LOC126749605 [Anthonomus grandis grandis]